MRITSLEASMTYDAEGNEFLHDMQARCTPVLCNAGFTGDGITCSDVDECVVYAPCDSHAVCTNTYGTALALA
jgi:hypothetical protein